MLESSLTRPAGVAAAVKLLYATLALGVLRSLLEFRALSESAPAEFVLTVWFFTIAIMLALIYNIGAGRNWARITLLVLFGLGLPFSIKPLVQSFSLSPLSGVLGLGQMVAQITALVLLFRSESNAWFRRPKKPEKRGESVEF